MRGLSVLLACHGHGISMNCYYVDATTGARAVTSGEVVCVVCERRVETKQVEASRVHRNCIGVNALPLGDWLEACLTKMGITKARLRRWWGRGCGCQKRQGKLNQIGLLLSHGLRRIFR